MRNGLFVTLEGVDGAGTTTVAEGLENEYGDVMMTSEPSDLWTGKQVRKCLQSDSGTNPLTDFYFFMGDRVHHIENRVRPAVQEGQMVISDRYADSTRAYQSIALEEAGIPRGHVMPYIESVMGPFNYEPDLTLWLDVDVGTSFDRVDGDEKYEQESGFQERVRENYEDLYERYDRIVRIDANQSKEAVLRDCIEEIETFK
ncbi:thymidylate kinase [Halogranum tailed virus 1]|uniref:dTMP kinase n=1 Tax=Halogranum tailed virus 1 TaxID=1273749 RepID=R4T6U6_9CAUD|nr:thymidylate kinase [Halogranum tailed virus 1]AGM11404.1 TMP kinase [Halogranum tailed virus 1]